MADYNDIKQSIATNLPDNNNREITAAKLRSTLNEFIDKVEVTETGIEQKCEVLNNIDDEPTAESENLVKSGGVYTPLKELELSVNGGTVTETKHHESNEFILTTNNAATRAVEYEGGINSDDNYRGVKLLIPQNTTKIKAFCCTKNQYYHGIAFYSSSNLGTSTFISGDTMPSSGTENQIVEINVPSDATYVLVTVNAKYVSDAFVDFIKETLVEGLADKIPTLESNVQKLDSSVKSIDENLKGKLVTAEINHTSEEFNQHNVITRGSNGNITGDQNYKTIFLPIPENTIQIKAVCLANNQYYNGLTWYKGLTLTTANWLADYPQVSGLPVSGGLITIDDIPKNAAAIAVTALNSDSNCYVTFITQRYQRGLNERVDDIEGITEPLQGYFKSNNAVSSYLASMNQGDELSLITPHTFKNYSIGFSMNFDSVFDGRVSLETINTFTSGHIEIDGTNIYFYRGSDTLEKTIPHGLTISRFLSVSIIQTSVHSEAAKIIVCSQSGMFVNSDADNYWYAAGPNPYKLKMISGGCMNAKLTLSIHNCDVWLFGDSYMDYLVRNITTAVSNELKNLYIDGYPGRTSAGGLTSLNRAVKIANPKTLVWALGMNDGDTSSEVSASWLSAYNSVKDICKFNGIELVLVTIPTTPSVNNNNKNNIIRNSGYRYVDVAMAVGADGTGKWYEGLLSNDNVHPTSEGAKVIFGKYIADLPNVF